MDQIIQAIEVFAMVTGVVYLVLEILQKNSMWVVGILTSTACAFEFAITHVWASMGLNIYYVVMSVIGLLQWRKASEAVGEGEIHLSRLPRTVALWSAALFVLGSLVLMQVLRAAGDPAPRLDAVAVTLSVIATWWLAQSYLQQWLLWIVADIFTTTICLTTGQYWMAVLYTAYIASAVYGYFPWQGQGRDVALDERVRSVASMR